MNTCIESLTPLLSQAEQHPVHGGVMANDAIASFYEVDAGSIRTLKKRLADEQAIAEGQHWLKGPNNKTLWTFRGFIRLGMRLSSPMALKLQQSLEDLLAQLNDGHLQIAPIEGQPVGIQLITTTAAPSEIVPVTLTHDEQALGKALGAAKYAQEQEQRLAAVQRISDIARAHYQELNEGANTEGKQLAQVLGLSLETVTSILEGAA